MYAINEVMSASGVQARIRFYSSCFYRDQGLSGISPDLMSLMAPEERDPDEDDEIGSEFDYDYYHETRYTGRYSIDLSDISAEQVFETTLPEFLNELQLSLEDAEQNIIKRLEETDDFARKVSLMFGKS